MNKIILTLIVSFISLGCSDFEYRRRPDGSEVAVIRKVENVFPLVAKELTLGIDANLKLKEELTPIAIKGGYQDKIVQLYETLDQISANARDFIISNYLSYINADLDPDVNARQAGRIAWQTVNKELQERVLKLREIKLTLEVARKQTLEKIEAAPEVPEIAKEKKEKAAEEKMKWVPTAKEKKEKAVEEKEMKWVPAMESVPSATEKEEEGAIVRERGSSAESVG